MYAQKVRLKTYLEIPFIQAIKKIGVITFCCVSGIGMVSSAFPTLEGLRESRKLTAPSMEVLGLNQQWRMFTAKITATVFSKLVVTYSDGSFEVVTVRGERVGFSKSAENRFGETVFWNVSSPVMTSYLNAGCLKYAQAEKKVASVGMLQAIVAIPQKPGDVSVQQNPNYQVVRQVTCSKE